MDLEHYTLTKEFTKESFAIMRSREEEGMNGRMGRFTKENGTGIK